MAYVVIKPFKDKEDHGREYERKDLYPAHAEVSADRLMELSGLDNDAGYPLIKEISATDIPQENLKNESEFPKHTGGGWYELSNGKRVKGKDDALEAELDLKK